MLQDKRTVASVPRLHDKKANDGLGNKCLCIYKRGARLKST
jgi:hypothetical protein